MPLLVTLYALAAAALSGAGHQKLRSAVDIATAALNVALNFWLVRQHSYQGSAWALILSFGFAAVTLWTLGLRLGRRRARENPP
jgi:O-antigen/teichoic acid export membrane protein